MSQRATIAAPSSATRILVASDQPLLRRGIEALFADHQRCVVVGEVGCSNDLLGAVEKLAPDVLIMDLDIDVETAFESIRAVSALAAAPAIIALGANRDIDDVREALDSGATGYVLKTSDPNVLLTGVRTVSRGGILLSPEIDRRTIERPRPTAGGDDAAPGALTRREQEVLQLVAEGKTNREIASVLGIGRRTVESHAGRLLGKLGVRNKAELVRHAIVERLVKL
jgi:two-component system, NarL family, response regulator NreC